MFDLSKRQWKVVAVILAAALLMGAEWSPGVTVAQNTVFAGSNGGGTVKPAFRAIVSDDITTNTIAYSKLAQGSALSVLGVAGNGAANNASIAAASDHEVMRRSGTSIGFGSLDISQANTVGSSILPVANGGTGASTAKSGFQTLIAPFLVRRTSTQTVTDSTTLVADNQLTLTLSASTTYRFHIQYFMTTVATSGAKLDCAGGTATFTSFNANYAFHRSAAGSVCVQGASESTAAGQTFAVTVVDVIGTCVINGGGTFVPRFAQNAETGAAESVIAGVNSSMWVVPVP